MGEVTCNQDLACCAVEARRAIPPVNLAALLRLPAPVFVGVGQPVLPFDSFPSLRVKVGDALTVVVSPDHTGATMTFRIRF